MVACMEEAHPKRVPRSVGYYIRNNIFDYLLRVIISTIKVAFIPLMMYFTVGYVVGVRGIYYPRHTFIISKNTPKGVYS